MTDTAKFVDPSKDTVSPWMPMTKPMDLKHIGKLQEELGELNAALSRCMIQGIEESEPVTGKINRLWVEEELADVLACIKLLTQHFDLDVVFIKGRSAIKMDRLRKWHAMERAP